MIVLFVVSCDKNELGNDSVSSINALEQPTSLLGEHEDLVMSFLDNLSSFSKDKKGQASLTSKSGDYIAFHILSKDDVSYVVLADESNDDFCFGDALVSTLFFDNSAGDGSVLTVEDANGNLTGVSVTGNWTAVFAGGNNSIVKLDANNNNIGATTFDENNVASF